MRSDRLGHKSDDDFKCLRRAEKTVIGHNAAVPERHSFLCLASAVHF